MALAAFALTLRQAFLLSTSGVAAGEALVAFDLAAVRALICGYGLWQALKQVSDGVPRTFEVVGALVVVVALGYVG